MVRARKRKFCPVNVAWLLLQSGKIFVHLDNSEVYRWHSVAKHWIKIKFFKTTPTERDGVKFSGGYLCAKFRIKIDGEWHRQNCFKHRIVWMAKHKIELLPRDQIDHGPAGKHCDHWSNLERVTPSENSKRAANGHPTSWDEP